MLGGNDMDDLSECENKIIFHTKYTHKYFLYIPVSFGKKTFRRATGYVQSFMAGRNLSDPASCVH